VINAIRAHLAEFGIVAPVGRHGVEELLNVVTDPNDRRVPECQSAFKFDPSSASNFGSDANLVQLLFRAD
jgi:hypothetical protein